MLSEVLWTEKYRPTELDDVAMPEDARAMVAGWIEAGEIPHILMMGPPGTGKTTLARIITRNLDCKVLALNASNERGIDTIRDKVRDFARTMLGARWNVPFLDEADQLTKDAQASLRNTMESYADRCRFILTGNAPHKIIGAIQSRCVPLEMGSPPLKERARILRRILEAESIEAEPLVIVGYAQRYRDMRRMIHAAQRSVQLQNALVPAEEMGTSGDDIYGHVVSRRWADLVALTNDTAFDCEAALRALFWAIPDDHPSAASWRATVANGVHETGYTVDPVILFLGCCADLISTL